MADISSVVEEALGDIVAFASGQPVTIHVGPVDATLGTEHVSVSAVLTVQKVA